MKTELCKIRDKESDRAERNNKQRARDEER